MLFNIISINVIHSYPTNGYIFEHSKLNLFDVGSHCRIVPMLLDFLQQSPEEWTARCENPLVSCKNTILTGKGDIGKVFVISQLSKRRDDIRLEIVLLQTEFFVLGHWNKSS